ncbi:amidase family protein [Pedobacter sp. NJ-S-72]
MKKYNSLSEIQALIAQKKLDLPDLLDYYFTQIETQKHLNVFNEVFVDSAKKQAINVQQKIDNGTAGKLAGMVIGIKDNILYKDHITSASSKMLEGFISPYSSTVVTRLIQEDAIIIGRTNCDEFAMGGSNETSYYGTVRNAADTERKSSRWFLRRFCCCSTSRYVLICTGY